VQGDRRKGPLLGADCRCWLAFALAQQNPTRAGLSSNYGRPGFARHWQFATRERRASRFKLGRGEGAGQ